MLGAGAICLLCLIPPQVTEEIPFVGWTKPFKVCSHLPVSELLVLQVNSTEAENQTGKSKFCFSSSFARNVNMVFHSHTSACRAFPYAFPCSLVWRGRLQEEPDLWIHQHGSLQLHVCFRLLRWQVWRYTGLCSRQAAGQVEGQTGFF